MKRGPKGATRTSDPFSQVVLEQVEEWATQKPNEVVIGTAGTNKRLTRSAIHTHLEKQTDLGQKLMRGWMDAAVRSVLKAKTKG